MLQGQETHPALRRWKPKSPPLWTVVFDRGKAGSLLDQFRGMSAGERDGLADWVARNRLLMAVHLLGAVALCVLLLAVRRRMPRDRTEETALRPAARVIARPVAAALLIALLATVWIYPEAPHTVSLVNNFVSGLILLFERPIKVGDWVELNALYGEVKRIGIRSSTIRTMEGADVIVPNGSLLDSNVINWTHSDRRRRLKVPVGVAYGTDVTRVMDLLLEVGRSQSQVLKHPEPDVLFVGFGESSLDFELRFWVGQFQDGAATKSAVTVGVNKALKEKGIEIPFPQRDLHLRSVDPDIDLGGAKV